MPCKEMLPAVQDDSDSSKALEGPPATRAHCDAMIRTDRTSAALYISPDLRKQEKERGGRPGHAPADVEVSQLSSVLGMFLGFNALPLLVLTLCWHLGGSFSP